MNDRAVGIELETVHLLDGEGISDVETGHPGQGTLLLEDDLTRADRPVVLTRHGVENITHQTAVHQVAFEIE